MSPILRDRCLRAIRDKLLKLSRETRDKPFGRHPVQKIRTKGVCHPDVITPYIIRIPSALPFSLPFRFGNGRLNGRALQGLLSMSSDHSHIDVSAAVWTAEKDRRCRGLNTGTIFSRVLGFRSISRIVLRVAWVKLFTIPLQDTRLVAAPWFPPGHPRSVRSTAEG